MQTMTLMALLTGCEEPKETGEPILPEDTSEEEEDPPEHIDYCVPVEGAEGPRVDGSVEYADGTPVSGNVRVQMCSYSCYIAAWGDDGRFCFSEGVLDEGETYAFDVVPTTGDENTYAIPLTFVTIEAGGLQLSQPVIIPTFDNSQNATEAQMDAGNGLTVNIDSSKYEGDKVFSVAMDPATSGLPLSEFADKTIIGMWYFGPFDTITGGNCSAAEHLDQRDCEDAEEVWIANLWGFSYDNSTGLQEGDQVSIYNAVYSAHVWQDSGAATVNSEGLLVSDPNSGISNLSVLVLAY